MKAIFKKLLFVCFGIVFAMLVSFGASAAAIPGDVNGDSEVNIRDAASILLYANGKPVECVNDVVDANGDGVIDQNDAQTLLESITGHEDVVLNTGDACEHELSFVEGKERGTCPESGLSEHWVCSKCSKIFKDENATILTNTAGVTIEPIHISGEWKEEVPATKTENGLKTIRCTVCDKLLESEDIPATGSIGLEYTLNSDSQSYSVSGIGTCTDTDIVIPATYEGLPVTNIGDRAFYRCLRLTSVIIPDSVTSIGDSVFWDCYDLTSVNIPNGVTSIGSYAFHSCHSLTSINIPNRVTSIEEGAFYGCSSLTSITIPNSVTSIEERAFVYCLGLESIVVDEGNTVYHSDNNCLIETASKTLIAGCKNSIIPTDGSVTCIGEAAFYGCSSLTSITIPNSVTSIGEYAFSSCSSLTSITIPNSVISIGASAFYCCYDLTSITIPNSVTSIGDEVFCYCSSLTSIAIPNSITHIGNSAFFGCSSLTSITIPNSVTSIGEYAFSSCSSLTSITIPNSVTSIGECAFVDHPKLESIVVEEGNTVYHSYNNCLIETASKTLISGCKNSIIPTDGSVTSIEDYAFYRCLSLTSINIPNSVTSVGERAFYNCSSLTSITIPNSVISIGTSAFYCCYDLTSITIPNSVTSIGDLAFYNCTNLSAFTFDGTAEEWEQVEKDYNWKLDSYFNVIHCTDGDVSVE